MQQRRGVLLETKEGYGVVLTPEGDFVRLSLQGGGRPKIGEEVVWTPAMSANGYSTGPSLIRQAFSRRSTVRWAMVAAILLSLVVTSWVYIALLPQAVVAYVALDINPSVELGIDGADRVVSARGLNDDGERLLSSVSLRRRALGDALDILIGKANSEGYLSLEEENILLITAVPAGESQEASEELTNRIEEVSRVVQGKLAGQGLSVRVGTVSTSEDVRETAGHVGLSAGEYAVMLVSQEQGLNVSVEDLQSKGIGKAILDAGGRPNEIIAKAHAEKDVRELEERVRSNKGNSGQTHASDPQAPASGSPGVRPGTAERPGQGSNEHPGKVASPNNSQAGVGSDSNVGQGNQADPANSPSEGTTPGVGQGGTPVPGNNPGIGSAPNPGNSQGPVGTPGEGNSQGPVGTPGEGNGQGPVGTPGEGNSQDPVGTPGEGNGQGPVGTPGEGNSQGPASIPGEGNNRGPGGEPGSGDGSTGGGIDKAQNTGHDPGPQGNRPDGTDRANSKNSNASNNRLDKPQQPGAGSDDGSDVSEAEGEQHGIDGARGHEAEDGEAEDGKANGRRNRGVVRWIMDRIFGLTSR